MKRWSTSWLALLVVLVAAPPAQADVITDWTQTMLRAGLVAGTGPPNFTRVSAMVEVAMFDALNGIDGRYESFFDYQATPKPGASKRAAAVQAAWAVLTKTYGTGAATPNAAQQANFDARRRVSLTEIAQHESAQSIDDGVAWGQAVADEILAFRAGDGFSAAPIPFPNGTNPGEWRQTLNLPSPGTSPTGVGYPQLSNQTPWAIPLFSTFRPDPPPALDSPQYTRDFNEVKTMGSFGSTARTADQTTYSLFWNSATPSYLWNTVALSLLDDDKSDRDHQWNRDKHRTLLERARLLAQLNVAMADAVIGCWDAKYAHAYWRPITAIRDTADDGNPLTIPDASWVPMFATPGHPDYPSGHSCASGAAGEVLADEFGNRTRFTMDSDQMLGVTRSFRSFTSALDEVKNARIFAGIHFRTACEVGQKLGVDVARFVLENKFQRLR